MTEGIKEKVLFEKISQLHVTLVEFNKNSMELKKLYVGLMPTLATILYKLNGNLISFSSFSIIAAIITFIFILTEHHYYTTQTKLREAMRIKSEELYQEGEATIKFEYIKFIKANIMYTLCFSIFVSICIWTRFA